MFVEDEFSFQIFSGNYNKYPKTSKIPCKKGKF